MLVPVFSMVIFTMIFGNFADMKGRLAAGENYSLFVYAGLLPWTLFSTALATGGLALVNQQAMISKIYFPRLFVPAAVVGGAFVDMALSFGVMAALMLWHREVPTASILGLIPLMVLLCLVSLGIAFLLSALYGKLSRFPIRFAVHGAGLVLPQPGDLSGANRAAAVALVARTGESDERRNRWFPQCAAA